MSTDWSWNRLIVWFEQGTPLYTHPESELFFRKTLQIKNAGITLYQINKVMICFIPKDYRYHQN